MQYCISYVDTNFFLVVSETRLFWVEKLWKFSMDLLIGICFLQSQGIKVHVSDAMKIPDGYKLLKLRYDTY